VRKFLVILLFFVAIVGSVMLLVGAESAAQTSLPPLPPSVGNLYAILLEDASVASYRGGVPGLAPTNPSVLGMRKLDANSPASQAYYDYLVQRQEEFRQFLSQQLGREITYLRTYRWVLNGVVVEMTPQEAEFVRTLPGVRGVAVNEIRQPLTDRGPTWIGAPTLWGPRNSADCTVDGGFCGEGIIVGIIDTGINHDHPSFADVGDDGYDHTNPFGAGNYKGDCVSNPSWCNDKLIGMYDYTNAGAEDDEGHGSHTASTAAGNFLYNVTLEAPTISFPGLNISGVAPHANIISYRICDAGGCDLLNAASAIDQAVADGVDVLNYSIGGSPLASPWSPFSLDAQAFLDARDAGVFVATSAGNSGPGAETIGSPAYAPWLLTVGANTHDRAFTNSVINMTTDQGTTLPDIEGRSITSGYGPAPIVYAGDYGNALCEAGVWPSNQFNGEIVVCDRGVIARVDKSANVADAGGGGMILANDAANGNGLNADMHSIPSVHITYDDGVTLKNWLANGDTGHTATIAGTQMIVDAAKYADITASFSSRGPNSTLATQKVIKPDIIGPGVDIIAAVATDGVRTPPELDVYSGTSMSSPHLAGAAALLIQAHPNWQPAEIQSALMSTSWTQDLVKEDWTTPADPFDVGAGRVDLNVASNAGFLMNITRTEYENADPATGGDPSTLNMPSLATDEFNNSWTWTRTLVATRPGTWEISFDLPAGMSMTASPATFSFGAAGDAQTVTFTAHGYGFAQDAWYFAQVNFTDTSGASPAAHFPVAVKSTCPLPTAPTVSIALNGTDIELTWNATGDSYEVWRSESPYFTPADATSQQLTPDGYTQTSYTDAGAGDGQTNYYYKVIARNTCGGASSDRENNHEGVFSYTLVPGQ
jgi:subtilisin family serine protease